MNKYVNELRQIFEELRAAAERMSDPSLLDPVASLQKSAEEVGKAWGQSWLGYQSRVYYTLLQPPPPGMHFSSEWGLPDPSTSGSRWREFEGDDVESEIRRRAGAPDISKAQSESERLRKLVQVRRNDVISILRAASSDVADTLLHDLLEEAERICSRTAEDLVSLMRPSKEQVVRDMIAYNQGWRTAYSGEVDHRFRREVDQSRRVKCGLQT